MSLVESPYPFLEVEKERCKRSLRFFAEAIWPELEPNRTFIPNWHIDAICDHLQAVTDGDISNLLINMPPRHGKSLLVSVIWPAWVWISRPESRWIFSSYAANLSKRDSVKCRRIIGSLFYQQHFGHIFKLQDDQNEKMKFENDKTGFRLATSVGGVGTGEGGDFVVVDDPHKTDEAESAAVREHTLLWWDETMSTRSNDPKSVKRVIVMQRVHEQDLSGHVLKQGGYDHLCLPAEFDGNKKFTSIGWQDPRNIQGELLWPDHFGKKELDDLKLRLGSGAAQGQLQQKPYSKAGKIIKREWFKFYKVLPSELRGHTASWDLSFDDGLTNDYAVGQTWGKVGANHYLVDQVRDKMGFVAQIDAMRNFSYKHEKALTKLVEKKANGAAAMDTLKNEIAGLIKVEPKTAKSVRLEAVAPLFEAGNVFLPDPSIAPWINDFIEEFIGFPKAAHDDQIDATTQYLLYARDKVGSEFSEDMVQNEGNVIIQGGAQW